MPNESEILAKLEAFKEIRNANRVFPGVNSIPGNVQMSVTEAARELQDLDFVIYPGHLRLDKMGRFGFLMKTFGTVCVFSLRNF